MGDVDMVVYFVLIVDKFVVNEDVIVFELVVV